MQRPWRVLFISHDSGLYGAQLSLLALLTKLDRSNFTPWVVAPSEGPFTEAVRKLEIPVTIRHMVHWIASGNAIKNTWHKRARHFLSGIHSRTWAIAHLIENNHIDIVYTNTVTCIEGALAARITGRPHIWHLREKISGNSQVRALAPQFVVKYLVSFLSHQVLVNSHYIGSAYQCQFLRRRPTVIYNGVAANDFPLDRTSARDAIRAELAIPEEGKIIMIIGSIIPRKRLDLFVEAAHRVARSDTSAFFAVVGEGPNTHIEDILRLVKWYSLEENFRFLSHRTDIPELLAAADLLVVAADEEPFGRTIIEGMAAGVPVIATKSGGPEEIILDGITGLLVPRRNPKAMANAMTSVLRDSSTAARLVKRAKERLCARFTVETYVKSVQQELERVLQSQPPRD